MYGSGGYSDKDHSLAIQPLMQNNSFNPFWVTQQNYGTPYRPNCGELRKHDIGRLVELAGKIHKASKDRFIQLKDYHGITQLVLPTTRTDLQRRFSKIPLQSYVVVMGEVRGRPGRGHNEKLQTGDIEVEVHDILMVKINKIERKVQVPALPEGLERPSEINPPKITSEEYNKLNNKGLLYLLNNRKYTCADLPYMINKQVTLTCWIEKATKKFLFIMDGYGKIQAVVPSNNREMENFSASLKQNDIIYVKGIITLRPEAQINPASVNGHIELQLETLETPSAEQMQMQNEDISMQVESSAACRFSTRTHTCGELRPSHVGQKITLCGWMHFQRLSKFLILRDGYGFIQCVVTEQVKDITLSTIPLESVLKVEGIVVMRPPSMENEQFTTGDVEVLAEKITVLNKANNLQVSLSDSNSLLCEQMRLTYRYVDLRSQKMQSNLRLRSQILQNIRNFLIDRNGFIEVETPLLTKKIFDDPKNFLVETEESELFYTLAQSPQLWNQMLMAGALDRCFQISKCFKNEMVTADSQPEFTMLSAEMSFADQDAVIGLVEDMLRSVYPMSVPDGAFPRLCYKDALRTYGSPTPDCSFDLKLAEISNYFKERLTDSSFGAFMILYPKNVGELTASTKESITKVTKRYQDVTISQDLTKLNHGNLEEIKQVINDYSFFLAYGITERTCLALGEIRLLLRDALKEKKMLKENILSPLWIIDLPMFTKEQDDTIKFYGQPFPKPHADDTLSINDPLKVRAMSFDLVIKGKKFGSGAVRANEPQLVTRQLRVLRLAETSALHLIKTLNSGCPPHAGIGIGVDRLVAFSCQAGSIRDVIAFPKIKGGKDLVSGAPFHLRRRQRSDDDISEPIAKVMKISPNSK